MKNSKLLKNFIYAAIALTVLSLLTGLLMPKYVDDLQEGSLISEYYAEDEAHDILFVGDCEVYENFIPAVIWKESGYSSYIRGSAQQLIWQSYYLLEEMLEKEAPSLVVLNVLAMSESEQTNEAYNRMTLDGMKWSKHKLGSILASMTEEESLASYFFPILRFHSRWSELNASDFKYLFSKPAVSDSGALIRVGIKPAENIPSPKPLADYSFSEKCFEYLDKITALCNEKNVPLLLIKAPSLYPHWYEQWDDQIKAYADAHDGVRYLNIADMADQTGIDYSTDTPDAGMHLNADGAEKLSVWFAKWVKNEYNIIASHAGDEGSAAEWERRYRSYKEHRAMLEKEIL